MKIIFALLIACVSIEAATAAELANGYKCVTGQKPEALFRKLIETKNISERSYINTDGIPLHAAKPGLTIFGLPLIAVSGWQPETTFFVRAPGTAPTTHYAFIARANVWQLKQATKTQGIRASTQKEMTTFPYIEIKAFASEYPEALPPGIDPSFAFTEITCHIGQ